MTQYYLAIDIGASSGRHILGYMENGTIQLQEVHRFENGMISRNGHLVWDVEHLWEEILVGMRKCKELGRIPQSVGVDTWGVDFVLLDQEGKQLGEAVGYRDERTKGMDEEVYRRIPEEELYHRTGILKASYNTIYQLMALKKNQPELLEQAAAMLMMPDYFHYKMTGIMGQEYSEATTGQLVNPNTHDWDWELIDRLGYPRHIFMPIHKPGYALGALSDEVAQQVGYSCQVILPPTHDTQSAILAVPSAKEHTVYISSGTWSLMGTMLPVADCSPKSQAYNFTNEGGYDYQVCYLKNIMGLWMIQSVRKELAPQDSFAAICEAAAACTIPSLVDANDDRFLAPKSMAEEVRKACRETNQPVPEGMAQLACVIYNSLAACYARTLSEIESMTGCHYDSVYIVGGGSNADYLNRLTAKACNKTVYAGPTEGTAIGNLLCQMLAAGELTNMGEAKERIRSSFAIRTYEPQNMSKS